MVPMLFGLITFVAGALFGGIVNCLTARYAAFKESKGVALAIRAEMEALVGLANFRGYVGLTDAIIIRLGDASHQLDLNDVFSINITQDYFSVFSALSPKLGLLGPLATDVVLVYAGTKSLFEDINALRERSRPVLEGREKVTIEQARAYLLFVTISINQLLKETIQMGTKTIAALADFAERRWLKIFC